MYFVLDFVRRKLAEREPFPEGWRAILERRVPFYPRLDQAERERFESKLKVFARTKSFEGAGGFVVTEEARVVVSACAARLVMNLPGEHYGRLHEIVVYPSHYKHKDQDGIILGEAFGPGVVVLSYAAVLAGLRSPHDGHDTAVHEFAHALDGADGAFDGTPELHSLDAYAPWATAMSRAFTSLQSRVGRNGRRVLRDYGATNEAEFFAVATEAFFERPVDLRRDKPAVYAALAAFYRFDPAGPRPQRAGGQGETAGARHVEKGRSRA
ncbi:MAG: M90 family metallopeptidase [Polyangiaceae bacterium]